MPRKQKKSSNRASRSRGKGSSKSSSSKFLIIGGGIVILGLVIWGIVKIIGYDHSVSRESLDKYVELTNEPDNILGEGAGVYIDMSDGMNFAYSSPQSQDVLKAIVNKLAAVKGIEFSGLAEDQIFPLDYKHTALYNYILNAANYDKQRAPIEKALDEIIQKNQPALLMTDFEEYNGGMIQKAAYAKRAFIEWLGKGNNIYFYKWDFEEKGKDKHMFLAVFDDNANRLNSLVAQAIQGVRWDEVTSFVVGSKRFEFPLYSRYESIKQGGNYHNSEGKDFVTVVPDEDGSQNSYHSYFNLVADAAGAGDFMPMSSSEGYAAEYYPLGVTWANALSNAKAQAEASADPYEHLISKLFVDFDAQSGYEIEGVEVRAFDIQSTLDTITNAINQQVTLNRKLITGIPNKELSEFLTVTTRESSGFPFEEILLDFHPRFNGTISGIGNPANTIRANIVISKVELEEDKIKEFFSWADNSSLSESVKLALQSPACDFMGRVIFSYYFKALENK